MKSRDFEGRQAAATIFVGATTACKATPLAMLLLAGNSSRNVKIGET